MAILYTLVRQDTDQDGRLTRDDALTLGISTPKGQEYTDLFSGLDKLIGVVPLKDSAIRIIYQQQGSGYSARVSLSEGLPLSKPQPLPLVGQ